jgi:hypothetical protein
MIVAMDTPNVEYQHQLAEALAQADSDIGSLRARLAERESLAEELAAAQARLAACRAESAQLRTDLEGVTGSASWRLTSPLREALSLVRNLRGQP